VKAGRTARPDFLGNCLRSSGQASRWVGRDRGNAAYRVHGVRCL